MNMPLAGRRGRFGEHARSGAEAIVYLAASPEVAGVTGRYFVAAPRPLVAGILRRGRCSAALGGERAPGGDMIAPGPTRRGPANLRHAHLLLPLQRLRHRVRAAGPLRHQGHLSRLPGPKAGAADVAHRAPGLRPGSPPTSVASVRRPAAAAAAADVTTTSTDHPAPPRLRERLADHRPQVDTAGGPLIWAAVAVLLAPVPDAAAADPPGRASGRPMVGTHGAPRRPPAAEDLRSRRDRYPRDRRGGRAFPRRAEQLAGQPRRRRSPHPGAPSHRGPAVRLLPPGPPGAPAQSRGRRRRAGSPSTTCSTPSTYRRRPSSTSAGERRRVRRLPGGRRRGLGHDRADPDATCCGLL